MFRIVGKSVIKHGGNFVKDLAQGALADHVKSQLGMKYGQSGKATAGAATASILRARYAGMAAAKTSAPSQLPSHLAPAPLVFTGRFDGKK